MVFKIDPPYGSQADAQKAYDKKAANLTSKGYTMSTPTIGDKTISGTGTKTTDVKVTEGAKGGKQATDADKYMADLAKRFPGSSGEELAKKIPGSKGSYISSSMIDKYNKKYYKPKTTEEKINVGWKADDASSGKTVNETKVPPPTDTQTTDNKTTTNTKTTPDPSKTTETTTDPSKTGILPINEGGTSTKKATKKNRTTYSGPETVDTTPEMSGGGGSSNYSHDMKLVKTDVVA